MVVKIHFVGGKTNPNGQKDSANFAPYAKSKSCTLGWPDAPPALA